MIEINDAGYTVKINDAAATYRSGSNGGNCVALAPAVVPAGHPKSGRGPVVALYDTEDPNKTPILFTKTEIAFFQTGLNEGHFDAVFAEAATLVDLEADMAERAVA